MSNYAFLIQVGILAHVFVSAKMELCGVHMVAGTTAITCSYFGPVGGMVRLSSPAQRKIPCGQIGLVEVEMLYSRPAKFLAASEYN